MRFRIVDQEFQYIRNGDVGFIARQHDVRQADALQVRGLRDITAHRARHRGEPQMPAQIRTLQRAQWHAVDIIQKAQRIGTKQRQPTLPREFTDLLLLPPPIFTGFCKAGGNDHKTGNTGIRRFPDSFQHSVGRHTEKRRVDRPLKLTYAFHRGAPVHGLTLRVHQLYVTLEAEMIEIPDHRRRERIALGRADHSNALCAQHPR